MSFKIAKSLAMLLSGMTLSCGVETNPFKYLVAPVDKDAFDFNLAAAQAYYDDSAFTEAESFAEIAYNLDSNSERAAILLGYVYLGKIGVGPFQLAQGMLAKPEDDSASLLDSGAGVGAGDTLKNLSHIIGITPEEILLMGTVDESVPGLPVLVPNCAENARTAVEKLDLVRKAIFVACPFVAPETRTPGEERHYCKVSPSHPEVPAKVNFLWALAHLTEALAFHSVLTYSTVAGSTKSNLEERFGRLQGAKAESPEEITNLIGQINSLESIVSKVMPVSTSCSAKYTQTQLVALVNDMISVSAAFGAMPGMPTKISGAITSAMDKIRSSQSKISDASAASGQTKALKADFAKNIGATLGTKIDELAASGQEITPSQATELCSAYGSITGDQVTSQNQPAMCKSSLRLSP